MAKYDLPATIDTILALTNRSYLYYVAHSEGALTAFGHFSLDKTFAKKVSATAKLCKASSCICNDDQCYDNILYL